MHEISMEKAAAIQLPDLIDSVLNGDELIFTQNDLPVAKLVAVRQAKVSPQFGSAKGLFVPADDFDAPLEYFDEYRRHVPQHLKT